MGTKFQVGDLVRFTADAVCSEDRGTVVKITAVSTSHTYTQRYDVSPVPPSGVSYAEEYELKACGRKQRRAFDAGYRAGVAAQS